MDNFIAARSQMGLSLGYRQLNVAMWSIQHRQAESRSQGGLWKRSRKSGIVPEAKRLLEQLSIASCRQEMPA